MVEITLGGSNAPICHGAGRRNRTLSDLVRKIEYVDCHADLKVVDNVEHLRAASGCFGLMGVVTHITLEFPPMTYAMLAPLKMPVIQAVPPLPDMTDAQIPPALLREVDRSPEQKIKDKSILKSVLRTTIMLNGSGSRSATTHGSILGITSMTHRRSGFP